MINNLISKIIFTYIILATISTGVLGFLYYNELKKEAVVIKETLYLTNYITKEKPVYVYVPLKPTPTDDGKNITLTMSHKDYTNLILKIYNESNYSQSDIKASISNNILTMSHFLTTNIIKLPSLENVLLKKYNLINIGYTTAQRINIGYGRKLFNTELLDFGAEVNLLIPNTVFTNNYEASINIFVEF